MVVLPLRRIGSFLLLGLLGAGLAIGAFRLLGHPTTAVPGARAAAQPCAEVMVHKRVEFPMTPRNAWIDASDGVNVRAAASVTADRIGALSTGTRFVVQAEQKNPDGSTWYRIRLDDGRDGWVNSVYTVNYALVKASIDAVQIWLPEGYAMRIRPDGTAEAHFGDAPLALLYLQMGQAQPTPLHQAAPPGLPDRSTWTADRSEQLLAGDDPATDHIFRIQLSSGCSATLHEISLTRVSRAYGFLFLLDETDSPMIAQLLNSATLQ